MSRLAKFSASVIETAQLLLEKATTLVDFRRAQAVLLPAIFGLSKAQTAAAIGLGTSRVGVLQAEARDPSLVPKATHGGRRRQRMTFEEEVAFLEPWKKEAATAGMIIAPPLREALANHLGKPVHHSQVYRMLARHGWRKVAPDSKHPKSDPAVQEAWKKKLPEVVAELLKSPAAQGKKPRLMFQDEARFGRMSRPRRCWAPPGTRPMMMNGYEREFTYVYGVVSPLEGTMDYRVCNKMNTEEMGTFLKQVSEQYPDEYLLMVVDGASSHRAKALEVPANVALIGLPGYSPQLNPQENVWDEIREKNFPNRVYYCMAAVRDQLAKGYLRIELNDICISKDQ